MFQYIISLFYGRSMILYKKLLSIYYYLIAHNEIKLYKNNRKIYFSKYNVVKNNDQIILEVRYKKYILLKKDYNEISNLLNNLYETNQSNPNVSINKILILKNIEFVNELNYSQDEILRFILMYYGPDNDLYDGRYKIKLKDIRDDTNNDLYIKKIKYIDNNFKEITLTENDFLL